MGLLLIHALIIWGISILVAGIISAQSENLFIIILVQFFIVVLGIVLIGNFYAC